MSDGYPAPALPDGMACFPGPSGEWLLTRNHEIHEGQAADSTLAYDPQRAGGVSRLVIDAKTGSLLLLVSSRF